MGVLNWVQSRIHGGHRSKRKSDFVEGSARPAETLSGLSLSPTYEPDDGWSTAMLSMGTFGTREGRRLKSSDGPCTVSLDELKKLQEELRLIMTAKGVTTAEELNRAHHLPLERFLSCTSHSQNGGIVKSRLLRKFVKSSFGGFMPRPSFRESVPEVRCNEIIWGPLHKNAHLENSAFSHHVIMDDRAVQMHRKGKAGVDEEGSKWIRTDSEYIVLEI